MHASALGLLGFVAGTFYLALLVRAYLALTQQRSPECRAMPCVAVVVAARNEQRCIVPFLQSLERIDYPDDLLEIVLVDDGSTDATPTLVKEYCGRHANWRLLRLSEKNPHQRGQMAALAEGIASSRGEIVFTTDADCIVQKKWIRRMVSCFDPDVSMVLGYCPLVRGRGILHLCLSFDNLVSAITQAALTKMGFPHASSGGNLAYRRAAYEAIGGFSRLKGLRTGCDTHMTLLFHQNRHGRIVYCADPRTFVQTRLPETPSESFFRQIRRNSETFRKPWPHILFWAALLLSFVAPAPLLFLPHPWPQIGLSTLAARYLTEFVCVRKGARIFRHQQMTVSCLVMQLVYPLHLAFFGLLGACQLYRWKE